MCAPGGLFCFSCTQDGIEVNNRSFSGRPLRGWKNWSVSFGGNAWSVGAHIPWPVPDEGPFPRELAERSVAAALLAAQGPPRLQAAGHWANCRAA